MAVYRIINDIVKRSAMNAISALQFDNATFEVIIQPEKKTRSHRQNRYYWAVVNCISQFVGESPEYLHYEFKSRYIEPEVIASKRNNRKFVTHTTTSLTTKEFANYTELCRQVGLKLGLSIPLPDDAYHDQFMREYGYVATKAA